MIEQQILWHIGWLGILLLPVKMMDLIALSYEGSLTKKITVKILYDFWHVIWEFGELVILL